MSTGPSGTSGPSGTTGSTGTITFPQRIPQLPPNLAQPVSVYRLLVADYNTITNPTVKTAYSTVLSAKHSEIISQFSSYNASVQSFLSALQPPQ